MTADRDGVAIFWSNEDDCWIADIPDLEFCSAHGETPEDALHEVLVAKRGWLAVAKERGIPIPEPRYRSPETAGRATG